MAARKASAVDENQQPKNDEASAEALTEPLAAKDEQDVITPSKVEPGLVPEKEMPSKDDSHKALHNLSGTYIDNWSNPVIVMHSGSDVVLNYGGKLKEGSITKTPEGITTVSIASFLTCGTVDETSNSVLFSDGGHWKKMVEGKETPLYELAGTYIDNWKVLITVSQTGNNVVVNYGGELKSGTITSCPDDSIAVNISTFLTTGTVDASGNVKFPDGGMWTMLTDCKGKAGQDLSGIYIDNWKSPIVVMHAGNNLVVKYRGQSKAGVVNPGDAGCIVHVTGFAADGTVDCAGNVQFADGGFWKKQDKSAAFDAGYHAVESRTVCQSM